MYQPTHLVPYLLPSRGQNEILNRLWHREPPHGCHHIPCDPCRRHDAEGQEEEGLQDDRDLAALLLRATERRPKLAAKEARDGRDRRVCLHTPHHTHTRARVRPSPRRCNGRGGRTARVTVRFLLPRPTSSQPSFPATGASPPGPRLRSPGAAWYAASATISSCSVFNKNPKNSSASSCVP